MKFDVLTEQLQRAVSRRLTKSKQGSTRSAVFERAYKMDIAVYFSADLFVVELNIRSTLTCIRRVAINGTRATRKKILKYILIQSLADIYVLCLSINWLVKCHYGLRVRHQLFDTPGPIALRGIAR